MSKYKRKCKGVKIDVYDVLKAFDVRCPARQHAIKKILCTGIRGYKDEQKDLNESIESLNRAIELLADDFQNETTWNDIPLCPYDVYINHGACNTESSKGLKLGDAVNVIGEEYCNLGYVVGINGSSEEYLVKSSEYNDPKMRWCERSNISKL